MAARVDIFETFPRLLARSVHDEAQRDPSLLPLGPKWPRHMHSSAHGAAIILFACLLLLRVRAMQAACRVGGADSAACQWTGAEAQRAVPTAPPWVHVLLPFLLLNVLDVCIRAYFYQIGASWTPTRVPRNAQLSHLAAIVSAVCSAVFKVLLIFHLCTSALSRPWVAVFIPIYVGWSVRLILALMRRRESTGHGSTVGVTLSVLFNSQTLLISISLFGQGVMPFWLALWTVWLGMVPIFFIGVATSVVSISHFILALVHARARPSFFSPGGFTLGGALLLTYLVVEACLALSQLSTWVDGGAPVSHAADAVTRGAVFLVARVLAQCAFAAAWEMMMRVRANQLGVERTRRDESLYSGLGLPQLLVRQSSSLYRQASGEVTGHYLKLRDAGDLPKPCDGGESGGGSGGDGGGVDGGAEGGDGGRRDEVGAGGDGGDDCSRGGGEEGGGGDCGGDEGGGGLGTDGGEGSLCRYCFTARAEAVFLPCGHAGVCVDCASKWLDEHEWCPDCRGEVEKLARLPKARLVLGQIVVSPEGLR